MSLEKTAQRTRFTNDTFAHLEAIHRTSLWLTMRSSFARDLTLRTMTSAYCERHTSRTLISEKTHLFRILAREFFNPNGRRQRELQFGQSLAENESLAAEPEGGSLQYSISDIETMQQLLQVGASSISVRKVIAHLRPHARLIMILLYREKFSYDEIAYITCRSETAVRQILARLRRFIPTYILESTDGTHKTTENRIALRSAGTKLDRDVKNVSSSLLFSCNRERSADAAFQRWEDEGGAVVLSDRNKD